MVAELRKSPRNGNSFFPVTQRSLASFAGLAASPSARGCTASHPKNAAPAAANPEGALTQAGSLDEQHGDGRTVQVYFDNEDAAAVYAAELTKGQRCAEAPTGANQGHMLAAKADRRGTQERTLD